MTNGVTTQNPNSDEALDRVFQALSDRTRRSILRRLCDGPAPIMSLAAPHAMTLPAIGKHVRVLEAAGLVARVKVGREHVCSLTPEALVDADRWLETYRQFWTESLDSLAAEFGDAE